MMKTFNERRFMLGFFGNFCLCGSIVYGEISMDHNFGTMMFVSVAK